MKNIFGILALIGNVTMHHFRNFLAFFGKDYQTEIVFWEWNAMERFFVNQIADTSFGCEGKRLVNYLGVALTSRLVSVYTRDAASVLIFD